MSLRDAEGALQKADCTLTNELGETLNVSFSMSSQGTSLSQTNQIGTLSPALSGVVPAGRYVLALSYALGKSEHDIEVQANKTAVLEAVTGD